MRGPRLHLCSTGVEPETSTLPGSSVSRGFAAGGYLALRILGPRSAPESRGSGPPPTWVSVTVTRIRRLITEDGPLAAFVRQEH